MGAFSGTSGGGKLLAIGDMHLGIRPSGVPEDLAGVEIEELTPAAALQAAVKLAITERVDGVVFAGDLVENMNARFEALQPLELALKELQEARIGAWAVVGNHDADALPALVRTSLNGLQLIGVGGKWESKLIESDGRPVAEICGWSFPSRHYKSSPLADLIVNPIAPHHAGLPRLGLLHGDLNGSGSYAPFKRTELDEIPLDGWLLGHVHIPSLGAASLSNGQPFGYLGSLVGLDSGEPGDRGPWLIHLDEDGSVRPEQQVTAPLRWEEIEVPLAEDASTETMGDALLDATLSTAKALHERGIEPRALGLRVKFTGRPHEQADLKRWADDEGQWSQIRRTVEKTEVFMRRVRTAFELPIDLSLLAKGDDPAGLLARDLLLLQSDTPERESLLTAVRNDLSDEVGHSRWAEVRDHRSYEDPLLQDALVERLRRAGTRALGALLLQREEAAV